MDKIAKNVAEYRHKDLVGKIVDLSPVTEEDLPSIVRMRNDPKMMYYLNQPQEITLDSQKSWFLGMKKPPIPRAACTSKAQHLTSYQLLQKL